MTSQNGYKKRVLYISPNGFLGGAEKFVLNIAKAHLRLGHYQPRIIFFAKGEAYAEAVSAGIDTMVLPFPVRLSRPASLLKTARFISQQLRSFSPGILHLTMPYSLLTTFAGSFKSKARRV